MKFGKLFSWIFVLIQFVKRCICGRKKVKDEDDTTRLPTSVLVQQSGEEEAELASWDEWGKNDSGLVSIKVESPSQNEQLEQLQEEVDLFGDMQPVFKKQKKIRLKNQFPDTNSYSSQPSNRLQFDSLTSIPETELGTWSEANDDAWNEIPDNEIEWETQNILKEKKMAEREKRAREQQKKKEERDAARLSRKTAGNLGVKIS